MNCVKLNVEHRLGGVCRGAATIETRRSGQKTLVGYGAVFFNGDPGTEYRLSKNVIERVSPRAFDDTLNSGSDVIACFNHDPNYLLGRRSAGTLSLSTDATGL